MANKDYSNGYNAGKRFAEKQIKALADEISALRSSRLSKSDEVYMRCLEMTVEHCGGSWKIGGKEVNNAELYCQLAEAFRDSAIEILS